LVAAVIETKIGLTRRPWEHKTLLEDFRHGFTLKGFLFSQQDGDDLNALMTHRFTGDYGETELQEKTVELALDKARRLCQKVTEVLNG